MARRTKLHIDAVTASFGDVELGIVDNIAASGAGNINAVTLHSASLVGVLSNVVSAIKRSHGAGTFANNAAGTFYQAIKPDSDLGQDLGTSGVHWGTLYVGQVDATGLSGSLLGNVEGNVTGDLTGSINDPGIGANQIVFANANNDLIGEAGFEYDASTNTLIVPNLTTTGTTTALTSSNTVIQDTIIGIGVSGSVGYAPATLDRGIIFGAGALTDLQQGFFHGGSGDDRFHLGKSATSPTSSSFATIAEADYATLRLGKVELENANNSISLSGGDFTLDAGGDVNIDADGGKILFKDGGTIRGLLDFQQASLDLVLSSSAGKDIGLDTNSGTVDIQQAGSLFAQIINHAQAGSVLSSSEGQSLTLDANSGEILLVKDFDNATAIPMIDVATDAEFDLGFITAGTFSSKFNIADSGQHVLSGALQIKDNGQSASGLVVLYDNDASNYIGLQAPDTIGSDFTLTLPSSDGSPNHVLTTDGSGNLSFAAPIINVTKAIKFITSQVSAGADVAFNSVDAGSAITDFSLAESQGSAMEVYVGGALQVSGSESQRAAADCDFAISSATALKFAYDLTVGTVVQVVKRG